MGTVTGLKLKHVVCDTDRHGNTRYYVRIKGKPKVRIRHDPASKAFRQAYAKVVGGKFEEIDMKLADEPEVDTIDTDAGKAFIYVVVGVDAVKVGRTTQAKRRLAGIQTGHAGKIRYHALFEMSAVHSKRLEKASHRHLAPNRVSGEWFSIAPQDAADLIARLAKAMRIAVVEVPIANGEVPPSRSVGQKQHKSI